MKRFTLIPRVLVFTGTLLTFVACDEPITTHTITVTPGSSTLAAFGATVQLTAVVKDQDGNEVADATVTWRSAPATIATVAGTGLVTATGSGTATITASFGQQTGTAEVTVRQLASTVVVVPGTVYLDLPGETMRMAVEASDANGYIIENAASTWLSSDPSVASIDDDGIVRAEGEGVTTITATVDASSGSASVTVGRQRRILMDIYSALDGDNWTNNTGWGTQEPIDTWFGVYTLGQGVDAIELTDNNLAGTLPPEIGDLDQLRYLRLGDNRIEGSIPPEIGRITTLRGVEIDNNSLTGVIPPEIGSLLSLEHLYLHNNDLDGEIPIEIAGLDSVWSLKLGGNRLTGELPPELGDIEALRTLSLGDNAFTGGIPRELADATDLRVLEVQNNRFENPLPQIMVDLDQLSVFRWNNQNGLCSPNNQEFQNWLNSIRDHDPGPVCTG